MAQVLISGLRLLRVQRRLMRRKRLLVSLFGRVRILFDRLGLESNRDDEILPRRRRFGRGVIELGGRGPASDQELRVLLVRRIGVVTHGGPRRRDRRGVLALFRRILGPSLSQERFYPAGVVFRRDGTQRDD